MNKETIVAEAGLVCEPVEKTSTHIIHTQNSEEGALRTVLGSFSIAPSIRSIRQAGYKRCTFLPPQPLPSPVSTHWRTHTSPPRLSWTKTISRTQPDPERHSTLGRTLRQPHLSRSTPLNIQRRKLKIATTSNLARQLRLEVQRGQLRAEEQYHFHRLTSTYLAESVLETFRKASEPLPVVELQEQPQERQ